MWRSTVKTMPRSSTNTSLIWHAPVGALSTFGTKYATSFGWYGFDRSNARRPPLKKVPKTMRVGFPAAFLRQVLPQIVRAEAAAAAREGFDRRQRAGRDRHRVFLGAVVDDPHQLRPVGAVVAGALVADDQQVALEERHDGVGEAGIGRVVVPARHHLRVRLVGDVEDDHPAVDDSPCRRGPAAPDRRWCCAGGSRCRAGRRSGASAAPSLSPSAGAGQPPAADLDSASTGC